MATSPSDQNNRNVIAWLDRLQDSVRTAGRSGGPQAFNLDSRTRQDGAEDDSEQESEREELDEPTERGSIGTQRGAVRNGDEEQLQLIPDPTVPLGLIADLALNNSRKTSTKDGDETDDDNLVSHVVPQP